MGFTGRTNRLVVMSAIGLAVAAAVFAASSGFSVAQDEPEFLPIEPEFLPIEPGVVQDEPVGGQDEPEFLPIEPEVVQDEPVGGQDELEILPVEPEVVQDQPVGGQDEPEIVPDEPEVVQDDPVGGQDEPADTRDADTRDVDTRDNGASVQDAPASEFVFFEQAVGRWCRLDIMGSASHEIIFPDNPNGTLTAVLTSRVVTVETDARFVSFAIDKNHVLVEFVGSSTNIRKADGSVYVADFAMTYVFDFSVSRFNAPTRVGREAFFGRCSEEAPVAPEVGPPAPEAAPDRVRRPMPNNIPLPPLPRIPHPAPLVGGPLYFS